MKPEVEVVGSGVVAEVSGRGALAQLGPDHVRRAMDAVRTGEVVSLALPIRNGQGPVGPRRQPPQHWMVRDGGDAAIAPSSAARFGFSFSDDVLLLPLHGSTHMDALCHVWADGTMFGGISADSISSRGAKRLGIDEAGPIVTRVLIVDGVPSGRSWLDPGEAVPVDRIRRSLHEARLEPRSGDALFVRTGYAEAWSAGEESPNSWPGLDIDAIEWVLESGFCALGADNVGLEVEPGNDPTCGLPLHVRLTRDHGVYFCELLDLSRFVGIPATEGMLMLNPLKIEGATAGPVAPVVLL